MKNIKKDDDVIIKRFGLSKNIKGIVREIWEEKKRNLTIKKYYAVYFYSMEQKMNKIEIFSDEDIIPFREFTETINMYM